MQFRQFLHNGKAQTCAAIATIGRLTSLFVQLENIGNIAFVNTHSIVCDRDANSAIRGGRTGEGDFPIVTRRIRFRLGTRAHDGVAVIAAREPGFALCTQRTIVRPQIERRQERRANVHATTAMGVLDSVVGEVLNHATQLFPVGHRDWHVRIGLRGKRDVLVGGDRIERLLDESKQVNKVDRLDKQFVAIGFGLRNSEDVVHQIKKQRSVCLDIGNGFVRFFIEVRVLEQQARKGENRRERRAQLVAHDGEKLAFISRFLMQFIDRLFQLTLLVHEHIVEHTCFFGLLLHFAIQVGAQALKVARHGVEIARELGKFVFASDARRRVELVIEIARFDIMRRLREALDGTQQQAIRRKENAEASDRDHDKHHKRLLRDGCRNAFFVNAHRLGNRHSAANVAYLHALFRVAILVDFSSWLTVALKA